jgi:hypothetical protein
VTTASDLSTPQSILRLGNAFCEAQALLTATELDLFTALHGAPATAEEIRQRLGLDGRGLRDLLRLLVVLGLLEESGGRYRNGDGADSWLVRDRPGYVGGFLLGAKANLYPLWNGLTETLRSGRPRSPARDFSAMLDDAQQRDRYAAMMEGALQPLVPGLVSALDWAQFRSFTDVGGCGGSLARQLVATYPGLTGQVFDLPQLETTFRERAASSGQLGRLRFQAGDFFRDPLPSADVLIMGHILHNWPRPGRAELIGKAFDAVSPGGLLLVYDRMLDEHEPTGDNLVASLIMALVTEEGAEYAVRDLDELARSAGFASVSRSRLDDHETLVMCRKPAS